MSFISGAVQSMCRLNQRSLHRAYDHHRKTDIDGVSQSIMCELFFLLHSKWTHTIKQATDAGTDGLKVSTNRHENVPHAARVFNTKRYWTEWWGGATGVVCVLISLQLSAMLLGHRPTQFRGKKKNGRTKYS